MPLLEQIMTGISMITVGKTITGNGSSAEGNRELIGMLARYIENSGGFDALRAKFISKGMQHQFASWISTRPNEGLSGTQLEQVIGDGIDEIAQRTGMSPIEISQEFSQLIPQIIDKMTPTGVFPDQETANRILEKMLEIE